MGLDGVLTEHDCHGIVDVRGRDVAVRVDILQSLNKSVFGIVDLSRSISAFMEMAERAAFGRPLLLRDY
jgi:hypothetical protein